MYQCNTNNIPYLIAAMWTMRGELRKVVERSLDNIIMYNNNLKYGFSFFPFLFCVVFQVCCFPSPSSPHHCYDVPLYYLRTKIVAHLPVCPFLLRLTPQTAEIERRRRSGRKERQHLYTQEARWRAGLNATSVKKLSGATAS